MSEKSRADGWLAILLLAILVALILGYAWGTNATWPKVRAEGYRLGVAACEINQTPEEACCGIADQVNERFPDPGETGQFEEGA